MADTSTGVIVGRFMPPHAGNLYVAEFARSFTDRQIIVLLADASDCMEPALRLQWLRELLPYAEILVCEQPPGNLVTWFARAVQGKIDFLLGSDEGDARLAEQLRVRFIPVDPQRVSLPITGEKMRVAPLRHWGYLPACVRPHFVKRICVFGPESTGKSTLAINLARHFETISVPEWARELIASKQDKLFEEDFVLFARGQRAAENALARHANKVLFCDTDALVTYIWADWLYGRCAQEILSLVDSGRYDLYLLTDVDVPWVQDPQRYLPDKRREFFDRCRLELEKRSLPYAVISGSWQERFDNAVRAVEVVVKNEGDPVFLS